jgi:hypothetical protein
MTSTWLKPLPLICSVPNSLYGTTRGDAKGDGGSGNDNSLDSVPWDPKFYWECPATSSVRYERDKSCIILHSKSVKIPVVAVNDIPSMPSQPPVFSSYRCVGGNDTPVMTYRIRYASGRTVDIPVPGAISATGG